MTEKNEWISFFTIMPILFHVFFFQFQMKKKEIFRIVFERSPKIMCKKYLNENLQMKNKRMKIPKKLKWLKGKSG